MNKDELKIDVQQLVAKNLRTRVCILSEFN